MLVTLKTLQEDIFTVEVDPSETVKYFKEKIEKVKGQEFPAKNMKLMYAGKFLVDNKRVSDYNVEEKKFVIVVVKKPKAVFVKEEPEAESSSDMSQERSNFMNGQRNPDEALILQITELGFTRAEVEAALNASYNNPDRAVEYLINGAIPSSSNDDAETEARRRNPDHISDSSDARLLRQISQSGPPSPGSANMPNQETILQIFANAMDESRNQTRITDRMLEQHNERITQNIAELEAELRSARAMAEPTRAAAEATRAVAAVACSSLSDSDLISAVSGGSNRISSDRMFESFSNAFHEAQALSFAGNLVDRDHEAIERLKQLGFSDQKAIEAYFVCERNENAAADYLFSQNFE